ncbi:hypothetical protein pipiens_019447, partial [Culex pipiens pipiens]
MRRFKGKLPGLSTRDQTVIAILFPVFDLRLISSVFLKTNPPIHQQWP